MRYKYCQNLNLKGKERGELFSNTTTTLVRTEIILPNKTEAGV